MIYKYCDDETKIKLHSIFKWSYKIGCPLNFKPFNHKQIFKIPNNLEGDITKIHMSCNPYRLYKKIQSEMIFSPCYFYGICEILDKYSFYINNKKIQESTFLITLSYLSSQCHYNLDSGFNDVHPLPNNDILENKYKIQLDFSTYVSNLKIHITTTTQKYTFNLN